MVSVHFEFAISYLFDLEFFVFASSFYNVEQKEYFSTCDSLQKENFHV